MGDRASASEQERRFLEATATFGATLERLARGYKRDADKRRDLLQDIHIALLGSLAGFDGRCSLRTWVYRVAHDTATSKTLRPRTNAPTLVAIDDTLATLAESAAEEQRLDRTRAIEPLHDLIGRLKPLDRQVMLLYLEQVDTASIAEITGLSTANVSTRVHRIKQILVRQFHEGSGDGTHT